MGVALVLSAPAGAQDQPTAPSAPGPALVVVVAVDEADAPTADALTELLVGAVAARDPGRAIVGKEELQAQLHQTDEETLECVGSPPCLGRVGLQLGVDRVVAASLARRGSAEWAFDLHRLDARSGASLGHAFREVEGDVGALADALLAAFAALDRAPPPEPARLTVVVDGVGARVRVDGETWEPDGSDALARPVDPGRHRVEVSAEGYEAWSREVELGPGESVQVVAGLTRVAEPPPPPPAPARGRWSPVLWVGLGVTVAAVGLAGGFGIASRRELGEGANRAEALAFVDDRRRDARIANVSWGLAGIGLGVAGLGLWLSRPQAVAGSAAAGSVALRGEAGGASLAWSGQW